MAGDNMLELFVVILMGLSLGSFVSMASYRLICGEGLVFERSHCVKCNHALGVGSLIPLFSWLLQKGKCRYCKTPISVRYPLIELLSAAVIAMVYWRWGLSFEFALFVSIAACLMILIVSDLEHYVIPDQIQFSLVILAAVYIVWFDIPALYHGLMAIGGIALGLLLHQGFLIIAKKQAIGMGDVKFFGVAGLFLGYENFILFLIMSGAAGVVFGLIWRLLTKNKIFPFGPALAASLFTLLLADGLYNLSLL